MFEQSEIFRRNRLPLIDRLRHVLRNHQECELLRLADLRDGQLRELGVRRIDIAAVVEREVGRLRLDEFRSRGWI
jgi:hypothetical protein